MKITGGTLPTTAAAGRLVETAAAEALSASASVMAATPQADTGALQSAALQPALSALQALPDFDHAKVAALREALAKGELTFDPTRLAGLIQRFHGGDR